MPRTIRFGLSLHHGGANLERRARGFAEVLSQRIDRCVRVVLEPDYDRLLEGVRVGGLDVAWLAPFSEARAVADGALLAAVCERGGAIRYRSAILVHRDAPWARVEELRGARAAWSDPASASGHLWPRLHLRACGLDLRHALADERFAGSARAACRLVASREADLCACYLSDRTIVDPPATLAAVRSALGHAAASLRVLAVTDPIPADGMVLPTALDGWAQSALRDALFDLHHTDGGAQALFELTQAARLVAVTHEIARLVATFARLAGMAIERRACAMPADLRRRVPPARARASQGDRFK